MAAAGRLGPPGGLRPDTYRTLIRLLAATGLRISEARHLDRRDVDLDCGLLTVRATKFRKTRLVPLHPTAAAALRAAAGRRDRAVPADRCDRLFVSDRCTGLPYSTVRTVFRKLCAGLRITGSARPRPRRHDLRHTCTCRRVETWYDAGVDLAQAVAALSVDLGHARVTDTYGYLPATPEAKGCWIWQAVTGHKPDGSVAYTEGRAQTQDDAVVRKRAAENANRRPDADRETVGEHLDHWLADVAKPNVRAYTWDRYATVVRVQLKPRVCGIALRKLTVAHVTKLWGELSRDGVSLGNVKKISEVFATALELAVAEEKIPTAPTRNARKPKVIRPYVEAFTDDEVPVMKFLGDRTAGPAFPDRGGGDLLQTNFVRRDWTGLLKAAGVPYRKFHALRHTHASRLLAAGVDPAEVAKRIGDRIETIMRVYAHWIADANRDTAAKVEQMYGTPAGYL